MDDLAAHAGVTADEAFNAAWKLYAESVGFGPCPEDPLNVVERRYAPPEPPDDDEEDQDTDDELTSDPETEPYELMSGI